MLHLKTRALFIQNFEELVSVSIGEYRWGATPSESD
jgi:hypothetical protein